MTVGAVPAAPVEWSLELAPSCVLYLLEAGTPERDDTAKVWPEILAADGPPGWMSLTWSGPDTTLFDDGAVTEATRSQLRGRPADLFSTLVRGDSALAGSISAVVGLGPREARERLLGDPFARLLPRWIVAYPAGLLAPTAPPAGPVTQRWGSAQPWPADRF